MHLDPLIEVRGGDGVGARIGPAALERVSCSCRVNEYDAAVRAVHILVEGEHDVFV